MPPVSPYRFRASARHALALAPVLVTVAAVAACSGADASGALRADMPLHLEDHVDGAVVASANPAIGAGEGGEWFFSERGEAVVSTLDWQPLGLPLPGGDGVTEVARIGDALRVAVRPLPGGLLGPMTVGGMFIELDGWNFNDWESVMITARTSDQFFGMLPLYAVSDGAVPGELMADLFDFPSLPPIFNDGAEHTYSIPIEPPPSLADGPFTHLAIVFVALQPAEIDILSVIVEPSGAAYSESYGIKVEERSDDVRRALYTHTPARMDYRIVVPPEGRLDFGIGVSRSDIPVDFRVTIDPDGDAEELLSERYSDAAAWAQHSVDLSDRAGQTVTLSLVAESDREGTVALWAARARRIGRTSSSTSSMAVAPTS